MDKVFVNKAFTKALDDYQNSLNQPDGVLYNSFLIVVIRLLITIYSELDLINPLLTNSEDTLKENLAKFGYSRIDIDELFNNMEAFLNESIENENLTVKRKNPYFVKIQKQLIDMLICKKLNFHLTDKEVEEFYSLLYTVHTKNPLRFSYNYLTAEDPMEVEKYFIMQMKENVKFVEPKDREVLNMKAYEILNYSLDNINKMDSDELDKVNHQVYDYFKIRENALNKEYLLDKAISAYEKEKNKLTSGNGYVDILLVMGVICTTLMLISIVAFLVF